MFLAPPVLDLICLRALDLRLLCLCCHFVDRAIYLVYTYSRSIDICGIVAEIGCCCNVAVADLTKLQSRTIARTQRPRRMEEFTNLQQIAAMGGFGSRPNMCRRDLEKNLPSMCLAMPLPVFIPLKPVAAAQDFLNSFQWIIWPHEVFSSLYHNARSAWNKYICPGTHEIQKFWAAMRCGHGNPKLQHPAIQHREGFLNYCIPLKLHGDGVPVVVGWKTWVKLADAWVNRCLRNQ